MRTHIPSRLLVLTAVGVGLVGVGAAGSSQAADPFVAGQTSTRPVALGAADSGRALDRAAGLARALGLPAGNRTVERLDDRFEHRVYDEVVSRDRAGRAVAIARFGTDGRVVMAVALGWHGSSARPVARDAAARGAAAFVRAAGVGVSGAAAVRPLSSGWSVQWSRTAAGAPVLGDGVRVMLWPDGSFHGLAVLGAAARGGAGAPDRRVQGRAPRAADGRPSVRRERERPLGRVDVARVGRPQRRLERGRAGRAGRHAPARLGRDAPRRRPSRGAAPRAPGLARRRRWQRRRRRRDGVTGRRLRRPIVGVVVALVAAATLAACRSSVESPGGLLVTSGGSLLRLDDAGALQPVAAAPGGLRHLATAGRSLVAVTEDGQVLTATAAGPSADGLAWRPLDVELPADGFTTGIDVSPDGRSLAVVRGHDDADRLELVVVDLGTGAASTRSLDVGANGPPSWLTNDELALEVVGDDGTARVVSVGVGGAGGAG